MFVFWFLIISALVGVMPSALWAQQSNLSDFESPIIEHTTLEAGIIGGVEVFGATVVDNEAIARVSLFYRFSGETQFAELSMREIASSSFYSVKVDSANVPLETLAIEYYIQAEDTSGNIVLKGFAFQPLVRPFKVVEPVTTMTPDPVEAPVIKPAKIKWVYVVLGVLIAGGVAAAMNDDSGGGSPVNPEDDCDGGCNVTLTFARP